MYGVSPEEWREIGFLRRAVARLAQVVPGPQRLRWMALPQSVVSIENAGRDVEELTSRGDEALYRLPRAVVWSRGAHLDAHSRIVREISPGVNRPPGWWFVRRQKFFPRIVECKGTVFSMIGDAAENLYHWTFDVLPRLRLLAPEQRQKVKVLVRLVHPFHLACLEAAGFPHDSILPAESMTFYRVENLLAAKVKKGITPDNLANAREIYLTAAGSQPRHKNPLRLYISRARATSRRILNEDQLLSLIEPLGYQKVFMETLPLDEQLALFRDAESIIAPTGAALTHIHVCPGNVKLLIFMPVGCDDFLYRDMAAILGLRAELLEVPLADNKNPDPVKADLILDQACFESVKKFASG